MRLSVCPCLCLRERGCLRGGARACLCLCPYMCLYVGRVCANVYTNTCVRVSVHTCVPGPLGVWDQNSLTRGLGLTREELVVPTAHPHQPVPILSTLSAEDTAGKGHSPGPRGRSQPLSP